MFKNNLFQGVLILALMGSLVVSASSKENDKDRKKGKVMEQITIIIKTNQGEMEAELDAHKAPETVANFLAYVKDGFYDNTVFHRVIKNFMIQGGGFDKEMKQKTTKSPIKNEAKNGLKNLRGTLSMARTNAPHSATSQFFINHKDNSNLDYPSFDSWGYAVFGKVTKGLDVLDKIAAVKTTSKMGHDDVPVESVVIESIKTK